jgi:hypothetical protein
MNLLPWVVADRLVVTIGVMIYPIVLWDEGEAKDI